MTWRLVTEPTPCACTYDGCVCKDTPADLIDENGHATCGCCLAHCPDVHPTHAWNQVVTT